MPLPVDPNVMTEPKLAMGRLEKAAVATDSIIQPTGSRNDFARSNIANWSPPIPVTPELEALQSFKTEWKGCCKKLPIYDGYTSNRQILIVDLYDFEIYRSPLTGHEGRRYELISLHHLEVPMIKKLCFDGFACVGDIKHYMQTVAIHDSSIEGYGDNEDPGVVAYVQSELASKNSSYDIWYRLNRPTHEYRRFHEPFLWVAQLAKHVIDYMDDQPARSVGLESFRKDFHFWLVSRFSWADSEQFRQWHYAFRYQVDFRIGVNAYIEYLFHQAFNLPTSKNLLAHPLWKECMAGGLSCIEEQAQVVEYTLATPDVYKCFKDMYFGNHLRETQPSQIVVAAQQRRKLKLGFPQVCRATSHIQSPRIRPACEPYGMTPVKVGDIISFEPDEVDQQLWRDPEDEWLAYVQEIELLKNGTQRLFVLYLYHPRETNMFKAKYAHENELFFSDNCNCEEGELLSTDVKGKYTLDWLPSKIDTANGFFLRQTYVTQESTFVSFQEEHKTCLCRKEKPVPIDGYHFGDTVYMTTTHEGHKILEPVIIQRIDKVTNTVTVRRLLRLGRDCIELGTKARRTYIAPNELILTDDYEVISTSRIQRRCFVNFVHKENILQGQIPFPYNRKGTGDFWYISMALTTSKGVQRLEFLEGSPNCFSESRLLAAASRKLKGLSIFSGGGSLDRGLEEGGAVEFHTAVDISATAIHTQRANARKPSKMRLYCGSVDDFLKRALAGEHSHLIARIGEVEFIAAGSPCPGFSTLQQDFLSAASLRNASHISTFCSFVDLFRPQYGILENVVNMASARKGFEDQNVLSQLVACLVSMGYQVNQYIMDAWNHGSAQQRSRVFLTIAAPGLTPIMKPEHTHCKPYEETSGRSLGRLPNGQRFGEREYYPTPFPYVSAGQVTSDLPNIGNGNVQSCIPYPDHRLSRPHNSKERALLKCIPRHPPGCGYKEAFQLGLIPPLLQKNKKETGKAYRRVKESGLIPTITTDISIQDSRNGACIHWSQHRSISLQEARRAQGYLDDEPIIGTLSQQYEIIGNGVDRHVSFPLGLAVRQAIEKNPPVVYELSQPIHTPKGLLDLSNNADSKDRKSDTTRTIDGMNTSLQKSPIIRRSNPSVIIAVPRAPVTDLTTSHRPQLQVTHSISGLDGTFDASTSSLTSALPFNVLQSAEDAFSRLSTTVAGDISNLSLSPIASLPTQNKRSREQCINQVHVTQMNDDIQRSDPRKRAKTKIESGHSQDPVEDLESGTKAKRLHSNTMTTKIIRRTRHSGLSVEFVPTNWSKNPERKRLPKESSADYEYR